MSQVELTLRRRKLSLTLPHRHISGGENSWNLARHEILQGFNPGGGLQPKVFLLYGLVGNLYDGSPDSTLNLPRRSVALTLGG